MHYHGPIVRPQTDADGLFIEVTVGCTHNHCAFCNFYDGYPFAVASLKQIEDDLIEASRIYPNVKKIWANGGNPYALGTQKLAAIGRLFQKYFPNCHISMYARVDDLNRKSVEDMKMLKNLGFSDLVIGFETGDDEALAFVNKGYTAQDILNGCRKLEKAGVAYRMIFLGGLSGKGKCEAAALQTASVLNQLHPYILYLNSVSILPGTRLYRDRENGRFQEAGERELVMEFATLLEHMENNIAVFAAPNTTPFSFFVDLQPNKKQLVAAIKSFAARMSNAEEQHMNRQRKHCQSI